MPPICWHLVTAYDAVSQVKGPLRGEHWGAFFLGSTAPDVRIITGVARQETHFYDLAQADAESGVRVLFRTHPHLSPSTVRDPSCRAFIAGYLTHLAVDELWIQEIYRPFFGHGSSLAGDPMADVMDRALQFSMDREERLDRSRMEEIHSHVMGWLPGEAVALLEVPTLRRWRETVGNIVQQEPTWELFLSFLGRFFSARPKMDERRTQELLDSISQVLEQTIEHVTAKRIVAIRAEAVARSAEVAREYLL